MTPEAELRMQVYQEGQRAYNTGTMCQYTDWRAKTWAKGYEAARVYHTEYEKPAEVAVAHEPSPAEQWRDICERSPGYLQDGVKGLMICEADLVEIGRMLGV